MTLKLTKKEHKNDLQLLYWVAKARTQSSRYALDNILIEPGRFVATDKEQLRIGFFKGDYPDGLYSVDKLTKSQALLSESDGNFPRYRDLIPEITNSFSFTPANYMPHFSREISPQMLSPFLATYGVFTNPKFFEDLPTREFYTVNFEKGCPVVVESQNRKQIVMFMNIDRPKLDSEKQEIVK